MTVDTRTRMLLAGIELFREQGYDGTGFREVVDRADAARGAIYHHFPDGKAQLGAEVVQLTGGYIAQVIEAEFAEHPPRVAVRRLIAFVERLMFDADSRPGCPVVAVTLAADDPNGRLRAASDAVFDRWRGAIADGLVRHGVRRAQARRFATLAVASVEGSLVICRVEGVPQALRDVGRTLIEYLDAVVEPSGARTRGG